MGEGYIIFAMMKYMAVADKYFLNTGYRFQRNIIWAMGVIKYSAAKANNELGVLDDSRMEAITSVAKRLMDGELDERITVDVFQTGSGTGLNMNVNEVIASIATKEFGVEVHPNNHVNMSQSSNDVVPSAIRIAALKAYEDFREDFVVFLNSLKRAVRAFNDVVKPGRTHLRDALPVTLSQELGGYLDAFKRDFQFLEETLNYIKELPLGGTAVGTGFNTHPDYIKTVFKYLREVSGLDLKPAEDRFRATKLLTDMYMVSSALKNIAIDLYRLSQDIRLMFSGPFTGFNEIDIPMEIAGSSMMPGKTNPVTVEAALLAYSYVVGLDQSNYICSQLGEFELSMGIPLMGYNIQEMFKVLGNALKKMAENVLDVMRPRKEYMEKQAMRSPALVTALVPIIGYDKAAELGKKIVAGMDLVEALKEIGYSEEEIKKLINVKRMTQPGIYALEE